VKFGGSRRKVERHGKPRFGRSLTLPYAERASFCLCAAFAYRKKESGLWKKAPPPFCLIPRSTTTVN
jgi:hypothetical protein